MTGGCSLKPFSNYTLQSHVSSMNKVPSTLYYVEKNFKFIHSQTLLDLFHVCLSLVHVKIFEQISETLENKIVQYVAKIIRSVPAEAALLPTPLLFKLYVNLYVEKKMDVLSDEWHHIDRFHRILEWKMRRYLSFRIRNSTRYLWTLVFWIIFLSGSSTATLCFLLLRFADSRVRCLSFFFFILEISMLLRYVHTPSTEFDEIITHRHK